MSAYKVEELLALRDSVSESAVSIEKFADEDVIKEHVLRPSASACLIGAHSDTNPPSTLGGISASANIKKPSPSPSIKRGKAERLLKEHGSPPGMRVTAGGRVVPTDPPSIANSRPRRGDAQANANSASTERLSQVNPLAERHYNLSNLAANNPFVYNQGQQYLYANNQFLPNPGYDVYLPGNPQQHQQQPQMASMQSMQSTQSMHSNHSMHSMPPEFARHFGDPSTMSAANSVNAYGYPASRNSSATNLNPNATADLQLLKEEHQMMSKELKVVEQTEVLQSSNRDNEWRDSIVKRKRALIVKIDTLRRQIKALEADSKGSAQGSAMPQPPPLAVPTSAPMLQNFQPPFVPQMYPNVGHPMAGLGMPPPNNPYMAPYIPWQPIPGSLVPADNSQFSSDGRVFTSNENLMSGNQFSHPIPNVSGGDLVRSIIHEVANQSPTSPGSATRRSHAVEIKAPQDEAKKSLVRGSTLNPKSPTYEPTNKITNDKAEGVDVFHPPTPSPMPSPGHIQQQAAKNTKSKAEEEFLSRKYSMSSVSTADFFPTNTHEHSTTRLAPVKAVPQATAQDTTKANQAAPSTPQEQQPDSPWNPMSRNQGEPKDRARMVEASPSRKSSSWGQDLAPKPNGSRAGSKRGTPNVQSNETAAVARRDSAADMAAGGPRWSLLPANAIDHIPSTYQEGYQAGINHKGLPSDPDVIRGYMAGLTILLQNSATTDHDVQSGSIRSHSSSSRGRPFGLSPHDSAISLSFSDRMAGKANFATQENVRMSIACSMLPGSRVAPIYSPANSIWSGSQGGIPVPYPLGNESSTLSQAGQRTPSMTTAGNQGGDATKKPEIALPPVDLSLMSLPKERPANRVASRTTNTPTSQQRFDLGHKEYRYGAGTAAGSRKAPDQRFSGGLDGAMEELLQLEPEGIVLPRSSPQPTSPSMIQQTEPTVPTETTASCFGSSSAKASKQKSSPTKTSESPKKAGEQSPAKQSLSSFVNKGKKNKGEDPSIMSREEKRAWREKWRNRFQVIRNNENDEIEKYHREEKYKRDQQRRDDRRANREEQARREQQH